MYPLHTLTTLSLAFVLGSVGLAQERTQDTPLRRAERTFAAADVTRDGSLDQREISRAGVPATVLRTWDHDGDRSLSRDEFLLYYRQLMINAGQRPGDELDAEAKRIAALRKSREKRDERVRAREKELKDLRESREGETPEEKYRRAQAALEARDRQAGEAPAQDASLSDQGSDVQAATRARVARAQASLQNLGGDDETPEADAEERAAAALALVRALDALEDRVKSGEWSREQYERARLDLILRARAVQAPGQTADQRAAAAKALIRVLDAMESRARSGKWTREQYEKERQDLILRARAAASGAGEQPPSKGPDDPSELARALVRSLDALENRARSGNWSREQYEEARLELIRRARAIADQKGIAGKKGGGPSSRAALALANSLDEMAVRARSGGWSPELYEQKRIELILRARASQAPPERPASPDPAAERVEPTAPEGATATGTLDPPDRKQAAEALVRVLNALDDRARSGKWSREQYERERLSLIVRARGVDLGVPEAEAESSEARSRAARALARVLDALDDRARSGGWSREMVDRERLDLILRARASQPPAAPPPVRPEERANPALALVRALDAMENRARTGKWTREQYEKARLQLILRARGVDLAPAKADQATRSQAAKALVRALDAMESRARSGQWTREMYEKKRVELIGRARSIGGETGQPPAKRPTETPKAERPKREAEGGEVKKVGGASTVKKAPERQKEGADGGSEAKQQGGADRQRGAAGQGEKKDAEKKDTEKKDAKKKEREKKERDGR